jgi:hypothetical protein
VQQIQGTGDPNMASKIDMVLTELFAQSKTLAAVEQRQADMSANFDKLITGLKDYKGKTDAAIDGVKADITNLKTSKAVSLAYGSGAIGLGTAIGYLVKSGILKIVGGH